MITLHQIYYICLLTKVASGDIETPALLRLLFCKFRQAFIWVNGLKVALNNESAWRQKLALGTMNVIAFIFDVTFS
jgi:hypothetical protein